MKMFKIKINNKDQQYIQKLSTKAHLFFPSEII